MKGTLYLMNVFQVMSYRFELIVIGKNVNSSHGISFFCRHLVFV
jgi:hypothetical protein